MTDRVGDQFCVQLSVLAANIGLPQIHQCICFLRWPLSAKHNHKTENTMSNEKIQQNRKHNGKSKNTTANQNTLWQISKQNVWRVVKRFVQQTSIIKGPTTPPWEVTRGQYTSEEQIFKDTEVRDTYEARDVVPFYSNSFFILHKHCNNKRPKTLHRQLQSGRNGRS